MPFVVFFQIVWDIPNLVSYIRAANNDEKLAYTLKTRFEMSQTISKSNKNVEFHLILSA